MRVPTKVVARVPKPVLAVCGCAAAVLLLMGTSATGSDSGFAYDSSAMKAARAKFDADVARQDAWRDRVETFEPRGLDAPLLSGVGQSDTHAFIHQEGDKAARWDSCTPIHYRTNMAAAPEGFADDVAEGLRRISAITGLKFVDDGPTTLTPQLVTPDTAAAAGSGAGSANAGSDTADLIIAVVPRKSSTLLAAGDAARTQDQWTGQQLVHSEVAVAANSLKGRKPGFSGPKTYGSLLAHELGHVVGLAHVDAGDQVMSQKVDAGASYGAGDLAGLLEVGDGQGCITG